MTTNISFSTAFAQGRTFLLEGALGERLLREYGLSPDPQAGLARHCTTPAGRAALEALWGQYAAIAHAHGLPFLATTPTRRGDRDRLRAAGLDGSILTENVRFLQSLQAEWPGAGYVGGMMGCYGEAYTGQGALPEAAALDCHRWQAELLAQAGAEFLYGALLPTLPEAMGLARAMAETGLPYLLSFTLRRDGHLPDGSSLAQAIAAIDAAAPRKPLGYLTNCIHPSFVYEALSAPCNQDPAIRARFLGIQGNAAPLTHEQLQGAADLLTSDPVSFARASLALRDLAPLRIFGGCCGTDGRHLEQIAQRLAAGDGPWNAPPPDRP